MNGNSKKTLTAAEFDALFDAGEDIAPYLDLESATRPNQQKRVNVDFPKWMVAELDAEARRLCVTRQSVIKMWLAEKLEQTAEQRTRRKTPEPKG